MNTYLSKYGARALYIVIVPIILLISLINSGFLHSQLTAVVIEDTSYTALEYNYYYYHLKNAYIEDHIDTLEGLGFNQNVSAKNQSYNDEQTWWDYFSELAIEALMDDHYYYQLAQEEGYTLNSDELNTIDEILQALDNARGTISMDNYLTAFYGTGMTYDRYRNMLLFSATADSYQTFLYEETLNTLESDDVLTISPQDRADYLTANIHLIVLEATPDLVTHDISTDQILAQSNKIQELSERYTSSANTFRELYDSFSIPETFDTTNGILTNVTKDLLPEELNDWIYGARRVENDITTYVDERTGKAYFVIFDSYGESDYLLEAKKMISTDILSKALDAAKLEETIQYSFLGMKMIDR